MSSRWPIARAGFRATVCLAGFGALGFVTSVVVAWASVFAVDVRGPMPETVHGAYPVGDGSGAVWTWADKRLGLGCRSFLQTRNERPRFRDGSADIWIENTPWPRREPRIRFAQSPDPRAGADGLGQFWVLLCGWPRAALWCPFSWDAVAWSNLCCVYTMNSEPPSAKVLWSPWLRGPNRLQLAVLDESGILRDFGLPLGILWPGMIANTLCFGTGWAGLFVGVPWVRATARRRHGLCPKCRYDLRGLPDDAVCPECGTSPGGAPA